MKVNKNKKVRVKSKGRQKASRVIASPVRAPVAQSKRISHLGRPKVNRVGDAGDVIVIHREYIQDLVASAVSGAFSIAGLPINPGNSSMFPWLSQMATNFESYVFDSLKFIFETNSPTSTPGTVLMAVDYDGSDDLPSDKRALMSFRDAERTPAWEACTVNCLNEDLRKRKTYFVSDASSFNGELNGIDEDDRRFDDTGELLIASSNSTANAPLGEVYVEYAVRLMTPEDTGGPSSDQFILLSKTGSRGQTVDFPFGDGPAQMLIQSDYYESFQGLPIQPFIYDSTSDYNGFAFFQQGTYLITVTCDSILHAASGYLILVAAVGGAFNLNSTYSMVAPVVAVNSSFVCTGLYVIRNSVPSSTSGSPPCLGFIGVRLSTATTFDGNSSSRLRIVRIADHDSFQSDESGWVSLTKSVKPIWKLRKRERKKFSLMCTERADPKVDSERAHPYSSCSLAGTSPPTKDKESSAVITDGFPLHVPQSTGIHLLRGVRSKGF